MGKDTVFFFLNPIPYTTSNGQNTTHASDNYRDDMSEKQKQAYFVETRTIIQGGTLPVFGGFYTNKNPEHIYHDQVSTIAEIILTGLGITEFAGTRVILVRRREPHSNRIKVAVPEELPFDNPNDPKFYSVNFLIDGHDETVAGDSHVGGSYLY